MKVVFRLQFHATNVPQPGWDKLFVTFVPADSGKASAKTTKAIVRNGSCKWSDPIYETTRLLQDSKTKKYDEKLYKLMVAMGSSRASLLGEANINLADYADASKPYSVALPLHGCNSGAVLHVTIQLLTSKTGFREFEQQRDLREKGFQKINDQIVHAEPVEKVASAAEADNDQIDKVNARMAFKSDSLSLEDEEPNEDCTDSAIGIDGSSHTSESVYTEKHDISSIHEIDSLKSTLSGELGGRSSSQSLLPDKGDQCNPRLLAQGSSDWVHGWSSDCSMDNDLVVAYEENNRYRGRLDAAESSISELTLEVSTLQAHADDLGIETERFTQELAAEIASGEELAREVSILKSECSKLKNDFEQLKQSKENQHLAGMGTKLSPKDPHVQLSSVAQNFDLLQDASSDSNYIETGTIVKDEVLSFHNLQMEWLHGLSLVEEQVKEIQKKAFFRYHDTDLSFLQPNLDTLESVLQLLKEETTKVTYLQKSQLEERIAVLNVQKSEECVSGDRQEGGTVDQYHSGGTLLSLSRSHETSQGFDCIEIQNKASIEAANVMKEKICELLNDLEGSKAERENLLKKMDQMECYYESLIHELEESQKQVLGELQNLRTEHSTCLYTISTFNTQMEATREEMNQQFLRSAEVTHSLESLNKELERRAIASETALKRLRRNYSIAVDQLQKDLELLSFQVLSMFETNENLAKRAFAEASQLLFEESLEEHSEEVPSYLKKDDLEASCLKEKYSRVQGIQAEDKGISLPVSVQEKNFIAVDSSNYHKNDIPASCTILKSKVHLRDSNDAEPVVCQNQIADLKKDLILERSPLEEMEKSLRLQEERYCKAEAELSQMHFLNLNLEVFSNVLQETFLGLNDGIRLMKKRMDELGLQLEQSAECKEMLMLKLQTALDDAQILKELEANYIVKCNDLTLKIYTLEDKMRSITEENDLLTQRITKFENLSVECRGYRNKYEACEAEKVDLENLLKQECLEKSLLQNEISSVVEELKASKLECDRQSSMKDNLETSVTSLRDKLRDLRSYMISFHEQIGSPTLASKALQQEMEDENFTSILHLEELQQKACEQILKLTQEKKDMEEQRSIAEGSLDSAESQMLLMKQKFESDIQDMVTKLDAANAQVEKLQLELEDVAYKHRLSSEAEEKYAAQNTELSSNLKSLENELQHLNGENRELAEKALAFNNVNKELEKTKLTVVDYMQENKALVMSVHAGDEKSLQLGNELSKLNESLRCACNELQSERVFRDELEAQNTELLSKLTSLENQPQHITSENNELAQKILDLDNVKKELEKTKLTVVESMQENEALMMLVQAGNEKSIQLENEHSSLKKSLKCACDELQSERVFRDELDAQNTDLSAKLTSLENELQRLTGENSELAQKILELEKTKLTAIEHMQENKALMTSVQAGNEKSLQLENELSSLKESLKCACNELQSERGFKDELENTIADLTSQLKVKHDQMLAFNDQKTELVHLRHRVSELELESSRLVNCLTQSEECCRKGVEDASLLRLQLTDLDVNLAAAHGCLLAADIESIFAKSQFWTRLPELLDQMKSLERSNEELQLKHMDVITRLKDQMASEAHYVEENAKLMTSLQSLSSELNIIVNEKKELMAYVAKKSAMWAELENCKAMESIAELEINQEKHKHEVEVEQLKSLLVSLEQEIDNLMCSRDELEITVTVLRSKLDEQDYELIKLRNQLDELTQRLSEQILKTEEFKNLSIHLKELKDKAEAECSLAREKGEAEAQSVAMQESLRIAFIREQCETKLQELRSQLSISKKYGEEMLLKWQDTLDEIENRKKNEVSHVKRNEELSIRILELETELQKILSAKREMAEAYDRMKAELECSMISLDSCKEEKLKLEASLGECNDERNKISVELDSVKERLEMFASANILGRDNLRPELTDSMITEPIPGGHRETGVESSTAGSCSIDKNAVDTYTPDDTNKGNCPEFSCSSSTLSSYQGVEEAVRDSSNEGKHPQDGIISRSAHEVSKQVLLKQDQLQNSLNNVVLMNERFKEQSLKSSMERLHKELESMKNDNLASLLQHDDNHSAIQGLQTELLQLHMANERLGSMFPLFNEFSGSRNALERVLALEIELAESLQSKKKSSINFQSSFLKQHNDEEAIFQSFRDINELIKDMLEVKKRHAVVESELKDMQERYSELSLQFAEVEGERQKLVMTLKNVRSPKKP